MTFDGFTSAVHEFVRVQVREGAGECVGDFEDSLDGQGAVLLEFGTERPRRVISNQ